MSPYDPDIHGDFVELINDGLHVKIVYESLYGERMPPISIVPKAHAEAKRRDRAGDAAEETPQE